jgi:predicted protein tyrosine phosphatase
MDIVICNRREVEKTIRQVKATHVISLLDPDVFAFVPDEINISRTFIPIIHNIQKIRIVMKDEIDPNISHSPKIEQIESILDWAKDLVNNEIIIVHCEAGISRSPAMALGLLVQRLLRTSNYRPYEIDFAIDRLLQIRPHCFPNELIIRHCDKLLECKGELINKVNSRIWSKIPIIGQFNA